MRRYSDILSEAIEKSGLKLYKICEKVGDIVGNSPSIHYISRLQNGKNPPAGDELNQALATVLEIDPIEFKAAAYLEKIPDDVLEKIKECIA
jgi:transcriptional regulator with XRE-family HTH domain